MHRVVPELIVENFRAGRFGGEFQAVGMFLDLSGFSKMTDVLMQHGQHGAEVLAGLMHGVFDPLVESIFEYGGRIVSFAGDGVMALYPVEGDERRTALRALGSAWMIQHHLLDHPERHTVYGQFSFSVKIGLAIGSVKWRILRSPEGDQATYYFRGLPVDGSAAAEHSARASEIIITEGINSLISDDAQTVPHERFHRFIRFRSETPRNTPYHPPGIDIESSRHFMPEEVIVHDMRGEFRQIVNLFMRIPDLADDKLEEFVNIAFELRKQYGGLLTRLDFGDKGCNLLMLWGAPVTYENDIGRALNFILDLRSRLDFPITAGVTYYIAHAGYLGSEMCEDYTCYGWGVNLASRFMTTAPAGQVWTDERVVQRVSQSFDFEYVGSQQFKGFAAEQKVHILLDRKQNLDQHAIYQGEMVGRQEELQRLSDFVGPLWQGKFAGVIGVSGDAGIGKGRLLHAFRSSAVFRENEVLWATCLADQTLSPSFNPLRRWLRRYFGLASSHKKVEVKSAFDAKLDELVGSISDLDVITELNRTRSILGALIGLTWDDSLYDQLDAEGRYNNTFLALIALIKAESLRQPLILILDDAHLIDLDTNLFLARLKRSLSADSNSHPVAMILTYRRQGDELKTVRDILDAEIELTGISRSDLFHLTEILLGGAASPDLIDLTLSRSEGNPYFAGQIIRYLQEENLLEMSGEGWRQARQGRSSLLPADIRALLVARLDKLAKDVKDVVQTASVLGREFEVRVLEQVLGPGLDALSLVSEAEKAAIWLPLQETRYIFHHTLLCDAAYSMQMRARRQELHIHALNALEDLHEGELENRYAELAHHAERGGVGTKAQRYYTLAGKVSGDSYQNSQAVEFFTRALAHTPFDNLRTQFDLVAERVDLYSRMGNRELQLKDIDALGLWAEQLEDHKLLVKVMMLRSAYHYFIGNYQESIEFAARSQEGSALPGETDLALYTQSIWITSLIRLGRTAEAMERARITLEHARRIRNRREEGRVLNVMGLIAIEQPDQLSARKYFGTALEIAREVNSRDLESKVLNNLAMVESSLNGNYALAREYYEQSSRIFQEIGDRHGIGHSLGNLGFISGMQGDFSAGRSFHGQALRIAREIGDLYSEIYTLINLSAMDGVSNDVVSALESAKQAVDLARKGSERSGEAWGLLYLGHAHLLGNELEHAKQAYQASVEIRRDLDQPSLSMEPLAGLVSAHLAGNDMVMASRAAEEILNFLEAGSTLDGVEEPLRVYYTCYQYLQESNDPRAGRLLQTAKEMLDMQVSKFSDETDRRRYVENIPWRLAIRLAQ